MSDPSFSICVYCGSKPGTDPQYGQAAVKVGQWIARHGGQLVKWTRNLGQVFKWDTV